MEFGNGLFGGLFKEEVIGYDLIFEILDIEVRGGNLFFDGVIDSFDFVDVLILVDFVLYYFLIDFVIKDAVIKEDIFDFFHFCDDEIIFLD